MNLKTSMTLLFLMLAPILAPAAPVPPRDTLKQLIAKLQDKPDDQDLREKIIKTALKMRPKPAVSKEAERFLLRGTAMFESATADDQYDKAAAEFQKAIAAAPWWGDAYFNLATVQEKAGDPGSAIKNLKLYLAGKPADAADVERKIIKLEVAVEELAPIKRLEGEWERPGSPQTYQLKSRGRTVTMINVYSLADSDDGKAGAPEFLGEFQGATLVGKVHIYNVKTSNAARCNGAHEERAMTGAANGDTITLRHQGRRFYVDDCSTSRYEQEVDVYTRKR